MSEQPPASGLAGRKLLFLVSEDWYFCSHRLPLGRAAQAAGAEVAVATRIDADGSRIVAAGLRPIPIRLARSGRNPLKDLQALVELVRIYRREKPDIVHHVALKPTLYGSIAAWIAGVPHVVNALGGLGYLFISRGLFARVAKPAVLVLFRLLLNRANSRLILQNPDDVALFRDEVGIRPERIATIRGSGVDIERFHPSPKLGPKLGPELGPKPGPEAKGEIVAVCVSRMLWDKGIGELVEAARLLRIRDVPIRIRLVGPGDANPAAIPAAALAAWKREGIVDVAGPSDDIPGEYARAHVAVLPSYREGLPKSLLEAAAAGLPMVATDVPGCREVCRHEETGLLVPLRAVEPLADALQRLAEDRDLRKRLGEAARRTAETEFSEAAVIEAHFSLYREMLSRP